MVMVNMSLRMCVLIYTVCINGWESEESVT